MRYALALAAAIIVGIAGYYGSAQTVLTLLISIALFLIGYYALPAALRRKEVRSASDIEYEGEEQMLIEGSYMKIDKVSAETLLENDPAALLIDVRTEGEFNEGHLEGAINIPVDDIEEDIIPEELEQVSVDTLIIVYCRSGRRSIIASNRLLGLGFKKVYDMGGL